MAIRIPSSPTFVFVSSIASAVTDAATFLLPQDTDSVTILQSSPLFGITTLDTYIQTSVDGGSTWLDMANMGQMTGTTGTTAVLAAQQPFMAHFDTVGAAVRTVGSIAGGSVVGIQQGGASVASARSYTGLPIMGRNLRIFHKATGTGASSIVTAVYVQNQAPHS